MCASAHNVGDTGHAHSSYTLLPSKAVLTYKGSNVFRREGRADFTPKPVQQDPVQKHDVCDEVFGAFVASVARKNSQPKGEAIEFMEKVVARVDACSRWLR